MLFLWTAGPSRRTFIQGLGIGGYLLTCSSAPAQIQLSQVLFQALDVALVLLAVDSTVDLCPVVGVSADLAQLPATSAVAPTILHEIVSLVKHPFGRRN